MRCLATGKTLAGPQANPRGRLKSPTMGAEGGGRSCGTTRELQRLKQQALEYYRENDVPRRLEELLNATFYLQPADVYGHLVGTWDSTLFPPTLLPPPPAPRCGNAVRLRREVAHARRCRGVGDRGCAGRRSSRAEAERVTWGGGDSRKKVVDRKQLEDSGLQADWLLRRQLEACQAASGPAGPGCQLFL